MIQKFKPYHAKMEAPYDFYIGIFYLIEDKKALFFEIHKEGWIDTEEIIIASFHEDYLEIEDSEFAITNLQNTKVAFDWIFGGYLQ